MRACVHAYMRVCVCVCVCVFVCACRLWGILREGHEEDEETHTRGKEQARRGEENEVGKVMGLSTDLSCPHDAAFSTTKGYAASSPSIHE